MRTANICYVARALESNFCHGAVSVADAGQIQRSNWSCLAFPRPSVRDVPFGSFFW